MSRTRTRHVASRVGNAALWVTAVLGAASLLLGLATVVAGVQPLIFRSSSMSPAIEAGALALAKTVDADEVEVGDVVSVINESGVRVTHRVVEVEPDGDSVSLVLQGDANRNPDANPYLVSEVDRVFVDVPYLGYVANWLATPWAMFVAGIVVALLAARLWSRRMVHDGGSTAGTSAAALAVFGLAAAALAPVPRTEAYFSDVSTFEAGAIQSHQVRIFDLADTNECVQSGNNIVVNTKVASPRYRMVWYRTPVNGAITGSPVKTVVPSVAANAPVATTFTRAEVGGPDGPYELAGISQLKGSATTPWRSAQVRRVGIRIDSQGIRCGTTNLPPTVGFTAPRDGSYYLDADLASGEALLLCQRRTPCGTATDVNGISSVEYRLQRAAISTQCWNPGLSQYGFFGCSTWRPADTSPSVPTTSGGSVVWRVPEGIINSNALQFAGEYTLYLRVTDNATPTKAVTERTIRFTVR